MAHLTNSGITVNYGILCRVDISLTTDMSELSVISTIHGENATHNGTRHSITLALVAIQLYSVKYYCQDI